MKLERPVYPLRNGQQNVAKYADIISVLYTKYIFILAIYFTLISLLFQANVKCFTPPIFFRQIQAVILKGISARGSS